MTELLYDEAYEARYAQLVELVEWLERQPDPIAACEAAALEAGLTPYDLQRILRWRDRWPHWRGERVSIPHFIAQKALLRQGHYGAAAQRRVLSLDTQ